MIFVTVGTDSPFDRMMKTVDQWAQAHPKQEVFAQIGEGGWHPKNIPFREFLEPEEFRQKMNSATLVIGHAGMGTILTALSFGKPVLVMPKRASLGEHRSEHQVATAKHLVQLGSIHAAFDEDELSAHLNRIDQLGVTSQVPPFAQPQLLDGIRNFISPQAAHS